MAFCKVIVMGLTAMVTVMDVAMAQESTPRSSQMWGTGITQGLGALNSAIMHAENGIAAAQVNAAAEGLLYGESQINMTSVGSQSIVNVEIAGDGNDVDITSDQNSTNSGDQSVSGTIVLEGVVETE